jgi:HB1, ASXL, restriction endonuclease HTH domain
MATEKPAAKKVAARTTGKKMSVLDAAVKVLGEAKEPLNAKQMIECMAAKGYWTSPGGKTPQATLYAVLLRDI